MIRETPVNRTYDYRGYSISVSVEADFSFRPNASHAARIEYVAIIQIAHATNGKAVTSRLRLGDAGGRAFASEAEALMTGYGAARHMVDDLFATSSKASLSHEDEN